MNTLIVIAVAVATLTAGQSLADQHEQCMSDAIDAIHAPIGIELLKWTKEVKRARPDLKNTGYFELYQDQSISLDGILGVDLSQETSDRLDEDCNEFMHGTLHQIQELPCEKHRDQVKAASAKDDLALIEMVLKIMDSFRGSIVDDMAAPIRTCLLFDQTHTDREREEFDSEE